MKREINNIEFLIKKSVKIEDDIIVGNQQLLMQVDEVIEKQIKEHNETNQIICRIEVIEGSISQMKAIVDKVNEDTKEFFERPVGEAFAAEDGDNLGQSPNNRNIESSSMRFYSMELDELKSRFK